jgi:tRNA threonylcarbamoyladenosine biosynthesis protein TsaE
MSLDDEPIRRVSRSPEETEAIGHALGTALRAAIEPTVVALRGDLGAGKTRFVRGLAAGLGADPSRVASPSFVLAVVHDAGERTLVHVDAWRLRSADDLASLGWAEWLASPGTVVAIEWADRVASELPAARIDVELAHLAAEERSASIVDRRGAAERAALAASLARHPLRCPRCGAPVSSDAPRAPFCSKRCRDSDLARWFRGDYLISRPLEPDEELE